MTGYTAPIQDMLFVMNELAKAELLAERPGFEEATPDLLEAVLEEAAKLASQVLAPLNKPGDEQGPKLVDGWVEAPDGFAEAYQQFVDNGWLSLAQNPKFGGQGLPFLLHTVVTEMWNSANMAFALCPMLSAGAIEAIEAHGSAELQKAFLSKLISGEWTGTMNLTEPQAGSDLAALSSKALPLDDHYLISGQKIFITWGDHQMTENIVHLVLARLPDAPPGVKGISLFLVPKYLVNEDGSLGERNDARPVSLEHKMGIHASPTCVMSFGDAGGAVGYLVGEPHKGLACMFTMMNHARLEVGLEGLGLSEIAYQQAVQYAQERIQGTAPGQEDRCAIVHHGDVRRMLMLMRAQTQATRAVAYVAAATYDRARKCGDGEEKSRLLARLELLTPIVKAWSTEVAQEVTSLGVQVHGGMGYIEETGVAQYFRDARITTIYEGTTGIQANDLVGRKIVRDKGAALNALLGEMEELIAQLCSCSDNAFVKMAERLSQGKEDIQKAAEVILANANDPHFGNCIAFNFLMLAGTLVGGWQMAWAALAAKRKLEKEQGDTTFHQSKIITASFYMEQVLPRTKAYLEPVLAGTEAVMGLDVEQL
jgi:alkylation response protein AidB-like acyl-CoA dehydrogenase